MKDEDSTMEKKNEMRGSGACNAAGTTGKGRNLSHLRRSKLLRTCNPMLTHWANFCRASGAYCRAAERFSLFAQVLIAGRRITHGIDNGALRAQLLREWCCG